MFEVHKFVEKPWGSEKWIALTEDFCLKEIFIKKGFVTSLQYHEEKREANYIHSGKALLTLKRVGEEEYTEYILGPGKVVVLPNHDIHRFEALEDLIMFEASTIHVTDVVRLEDSYGREGTSEG